MLWSPPLLHKVNIPAKKKLSKINKNLIRKVFPPALLNYLQQSNNVVVADI